MKKPIVMLFCLAVFLTVLQACSESNANAGTTVTASSANTSSSAKGTPTSSASPTSAKHFKTSEVVQVGDTWQITVEGAKTDAGDDFNKPQKDGNVFLLLDVSLHNVSKQEQSISSALNFTLRDSSGQEYTETIVSTAKPPDGKVEADAPLRGTLAYEVPSSMHNFTLHFAADIMEKGQTTWDIGV